MLTRSLTRSRLLSQPGAKNKGVSKHGKNKAQVSTTRELSGRRPILRPFAVCLLLPMLSIIPRTSAPTVPSLAPSMSVPAADNRHTCTGPVWHFLTWWFPVAYRIEAETPLSGAARNSIRLNLEFISNPTCGASVSDWPD